MSDFEGLTAIVTGGASGIGLATALELAGRGARVAVLDVRPDGLPGHLTGITADVTDDVQVRDAVEEVVARFGGLDVVVNNAGISAVGDVTVNGDAEWLHVLDVNVVGMVRVSRHAVPHLRRSRAAAIVNTCSVVAWAGHEQRVLYSASKGAVYSLTLAMAADHLRDGIRVNCVSPGSADTPWVHRLLARTADPQAERAALDARQPMGRLVSPQEVAHAIAYLASPASGTTVGSVLSVDGGSYALRLRPPAQQGTTY